MHAVLHTVRTQTQTQQESSGQGKEFVLFYCRLVFSPAFSFRLRPVVTRSNPQSNDCRCLTLIKGGQLTRGPGVTFIRRLVKGLFSSGFKHKGGPTGRGVGVPGP